MDITQPAEQPLCVKIEGGILSISVGINVIKFAAETGFEVKDALGEAPVIFEPKLFAEDVARELQHEEEDGTTDVHLLLDKAIIRACENGSAGLAPGSDIIQTAFCECPYCGSSKLEKVQVGNRCRDCDETWHTVMHL